jgi:7-keto-8-aminopelargonate synthetase-like enzyme
MHVERARAKIHKRLERNEKHLQRLSQNPKYNYPPVLAPVQALIEKNRQAEEACEQLIADFKVRQGCLYHLICVNGIKMSENPQRVKQLMGAYTPKEAA